MSVLPVSPHFFSDCALEPNENAVLSSPSSNYGVRRQKAPHRKRKPGHPSSKHTEALPCPNSECAKTFVRPCEFKSVSPALGFLHVES